MTDLDLDGIRARATAATEGPWGWRHSKLPINMTLPLVIQADSSRRNVAEGYAGGESDAEFIAHAREDVPALLARVEELEATNDAVLALHRPRSYQSPGVRELPGGGAEAGMLPVWGCPLCRTFGPCPTARAAGVTE